MKPSLKGPAFVFISALLFGSYGIWAVLLGPEFGIFYQGWVRSLLILMVLVPAVIITKSWKPLTIADLKKYAWCCTFGIFTQAPIYYAFQHAGVGISSLIFFAMLLITSYVIGFSMLKEKITAIKAGSLLLAIVGLVFTFWNSMGTFSLLALMLAAVNGIASGGQVATTKILPEKFSTFQTSILIWSSIFITHLSMSLIVGEKQLVPALNVHWLAMLGFTLAGVFAFWLVVEGFKYVDASIGGLIGLLEIVSAIAFGAIVFHEAITAPIVIGSILILIAATLPHIKVFNFSKSAKMGL